MPYSILIAFLARRVLYYCESVAIYPIQSLSDMLARDSESEFITTDDWYTEDLCPIFMGCATKNAKVVTVALGFLQRLIALQNVRLSATPALIQTTNDCTLQRVDIQLKILQTLLSVSPASHHSQQTTRKRTCFRSIVTLLFIV